MSAFVPTADEPPLQELQRGEADFGWRVLVLCVLLNRAQRSQVQPIVGWLFQTWPRADLAAEAWASLRGRIALESLLRPLGFQNRRAERLAGLSRAWLERPPQNASDVASLPGCGPYAVEAWTLFVEGNLGPPAEDRVLEAWRSHLIRDRIRGGRQPGPTGPNRKELLMGATITAVNPRELEEGQTAVLETLGGTLEGVVLKVDKKKGGIRFSDAASEKIEFLKFGMIERAEVRDDDPEEAAALAPEDPEVLGPDADFIGAGDLVVLLDPVKTKPSYPQGAEGIVVDIDGGQAQLRMKDTDGDARQGKDGGWVNVPVESIAHPDSVKGKHVELRILADKSKEKKGLSAKEARRFEALRQELGLAPKPKANGGAAKSGGGSRKKYPAEITDAVRRAKDARGTTNGAPGAKQHVHVRKVVEKFVKDRGGKAVTPDEIIAAAFSSGGVRPSEKKLREIANGKAPKSDLQALRSLAGNMDDGFCKGRNLASILVAWLEQLKEAK